MVSIHSSAARPPTLLYITASPRRGSLSTAVGHELVSEWQDANPGAHVLRRDVSANPVPPITEAWTEICDNLMRNQVTALDRLHEGVRTDGQRAAWKVLEPLLAEVVAASVVVLATPMYNYSIPASLKAWLDQITFPRMDLSPREFAVVAARGGWYGEGSPKAGVEHQTRYLSDFVQGHFSVSSPSTITIDLGNSRVDPLLAGALDKHQVSYEAALREARSVGRVLGTQSGPT
jgi:FMN-dependent NADH-azoreductase